MLDRWRASIGSSAITSRTQRAMRRSMPITTCRRRCATWRARWPTPSPNRGKAPCPIRIAASRGRVRSNSHCDHDCLAGVSVPLLAVLALTTLVAAFIQGSTGIGFALILAPVLALLAPDLLPVCLLALMVPLNIYVAWRERGALDRRGAAWITAGRFLGMFGGLWLLEVVTTSRLHLLVGVVIVLAAVLTLLMPVFEPGPRAFVGVGVATGISETATGVGGPPLALVYQHQ